MLERYSLYAQALTVGENERLEFLGDAVLGLIVAEELYRRRRDWTEAELSQAREGVVQTRVLARAARRMGLDREVRGGHGTDDEVADAVEALVAAAYLEGGLPAARELVLSLLRQEVEQGIAGRVVRHPKSELLEVVQARWRTQPEYRVVEAGAGGCVVEVVAGPVKAQGRGRNRREAETEAARVALRQLALPLGGATFNGGGRG